MNKIYLIGAAVYVMQLSATEDVAEVSIDIAGYAGSTIKCVGCKIIVTNGIVQFVWENLQQAVDDLYADEWCRCTLQGSIMDIGVFPYLPGKKEDFDTILLNSSELACLPVEVVDIISDYAVREIPDDVSEF